MDEGSPAASEISPNCGKGPNVRAEAPTRPNPVAKSGKSRRAVRGLKASRQRRCPDHCFRSILCRPPTGPAPPPRLPPPLPSPVASPNKRVLTVYSSGCAAFGHPANPRNDRSPATTGGDFAGRIGPRRAAFGAVLTGREADVLVDDNRCCVRHLPPATAQRLILSRPRSESKIVSQENLRPRMPCAAAPSRARRSCYDHASRSLPIAATATARRRATPSFFRQPAHARRWPILSTTVRPVSGRAVLRRPRGDERRPRASRLS